MIMMNIFLRLLAGHMLGDFVLQTGRIAEMKQVGWRGLLYHILLIAASTALFLFPAPNFLLLLLAVSALHLAIDSIRTFLVSPPRGFHLSYFLVDQTLHIVGLWLIATALFPEMADPGYFLHTDSLWERVLLLFVSLVVLMFVVPVAEALLALDWGVDVPPEAVPRITTRMRLLGSIERVLGFVLMQTTYFYLMPLVFTPRLFYRLWKIPYESCGYRLVQPVLSFFVTAVVGWLFKIA